MTSTLYSCTNILIEMDKSITLALNDYKMKICQKEYVCMKEKQSYIERYTLFNYNHENYRIYLK